MVRNFALTLTLVLATLLAGCGFQLRGTSGGLPFETLYIQAGPTSAFALQLRRAVNATSTTRVVDDPKGARAILQLVDERREKEILSLSSAGRVRELQLRYRIRYRVLSADMRDLSPPGEILLRRDFSFNDQEALSKESEKNFLYRDMQTDALQQLLRRLQATKLATG